MKSNEKYIYITLIKALTGLGMISRKITKYEYTHIAISFHESMSDFISFSRRKHYNPFNAGLMHEKRSHFAFGKNEKFKCKVFKVPVDIKKYNEIRNFVNVCENDKDYIFNLYSMVTMPLLHGFRIFKSYNCMSFVSKIIEISDSVKLSKPYYKYSIEDIDVLLNEYFYFEKDLEKKHNDFEYMKKSEIVKSFYYFLLINIKLVSRALFKRKEVNYD